MPLFTSIFGESKKVSVTRIEADERKFATESWANTVIANNHLELQKAEVEGRTRVQQDALKHRSELEKVKTEARVRVEKDHINKQSKFMMARLKRKDLSTEDITLMSAMHFLTLQRNYDGNNTTQLRKILGHKTRSSKRQGMVFPPQYHDDDDDEHSYDQVGSYLISKS